MREKRKLKKKKGKTTEKRNPEARPRQGAGAARSRGGRRCRRGADSPGSLWLCGASGVTEPPRAGDRWLWLSPRAAHRAGTGPLCHPEWVATGQKPPVRGQSPDPTRAQGQAPPAPPPASTHRPPSLNPGRGSPKVPRGEATGARARGSAAGMPCTLPAWSRDAEVTMPWEVRQGPAGGMEGTHAAWGSSPLAPRARSGRPCGDPGTGTASRSLSSDTRPWYQLCTPGARATLRQNPPGRPPSRTAGPCQR